MRRLTRGLAIILAVIIFIGMNPSAFAFDTGSAKVEKSTSEVNNCKGVTLTADKQSYSTNDPKITLTFRNTSETEYDFGLNYSFEVRIGSEWYRYLTDISWPALGLVLGAKKTMAWDIKPAKHFGFLLEAGEYRIVWRILNAETNQPYFLAAEFKIEPSSTPPSMESVSFQTMKVISSTLNARARAGVDFEVIGLLKKSQVVELMGESAGWSHIKWTDGSQTNTGYVSSCYIKKCGLTIYYAKDPVNVRCSADIGNNLIGVLEAAEAVIFIKKVGKWSLVEYNGIHGYVFSKYLTKNRKECFFAHPVAAVIGKRNIKEIAYTYAPMVLEGINTNIVPMLEVSYKVPMKFRDNSLLITVFRFDSVKSAQQVRNDISNTPLYPGWTRTFFQKDDTVICFDLKGLEFTKSERQLFERIRNEIEKLYGEPIYSGMISR